MSILKDFYSPYNEMIAYETLMGIKGETFKTISEKFKKKNILPTELLNQEPHLFIEEIKKEVETFIKPKLGEFSIMLNGRCQYPNRLQRAKYPLELFYYKGNIELLESKCVSVVGARKCTLDGRKRTHKIVQELVKKKYTIVTGLAKGIDTQAHETAIDSNGLTIAVIGTPIDEYYPKSNEKLQNHIAENYLLISQVPMYKYNIQSFISKRNYFPQRNITMASLSEATIIIEASDTSGTLTQAKACIDQKKKLFILESCFNRKDIKWANKYHGLGAIRVKTINDIFNNLDEV